MADPKPLPTTYNAACAQVNAAQHELTADYSSLAQLPWPGLADLVGPPRPRDLWVIGARPGNGKTTFVLNLFDHLVRAGRRTLYIGAGAEGPPKDLRRQWAALRCGYPAHLVLENDWAQLPADAQPQLFAELQRQAVEDHAVGHFADVGEKLTPDALVTALEEGLRADCQYVILDHIHRLRFGAAADLRRSLSEATRFLRDMAAKYDWTVFVAAQLHRADARGGPLRDLVPPAVSDLKESGTLEEDAVVALLLHRTRRPGATAQDLAAVAKNERPASDVLEPCTMCVRVGKHRNRGHVHDHCAFLHVGDDGRLTDKAPAWRERRVQEVDERYGV